MNFDQSISQLILYGATIAGAVIAALWLGIVLWTYRDMRARSRDGLAQIAAAAMVAVLNVFGLILYLMLRPRETLAEAYERSLEEEALLQGIEEKPVCPGCGRATNAAWQVCPHCHTRLKKGCVHCGQLLELPWNLCPYCATPQPGDVDVAQSDYRAVPQTQPVLAGQPSARGQRRNDNGSSVSRGVAVPESLEFVDGEDV